MDVFQITEGFSKRLVWAQIDLDAAAYNMQSIRRIVGADKTVTAVVKANAYGHGAIEMAKVFLENGADRLAVACLSEAVELRRAGVTVPILVLGHTDGRRAREAVLYGVDVAIFHYADAELFSAEAMKQNRKAKLHIAVDSGMGRIGYRPSDESIEEVKRIQALSNVIMEGIFTHFAVADGGDDEALAYTQKQYERFWQFYQRLNEEGVTFSVCHCCNSAGVLAYGDFYCDMVRPGIVQYGYNPSAAVQHSEFIPRPVMSLRCCITHIKRIDAGETVSYGRHFKAPRPTVIATLPLGYADGYPRLLSNRAEVLVKGRRVRQVGNICMDQCMIDVTDVPDVQVGDECVLFGGQGNECLDLEELAALIGTIDHEILCNINRRVPRVYVKGGVVVGRTEYLFNK